MINNMGQIEVPLYHGTSSFFLDQIREHGLGGHRDSQLFDEKILSALACALSDTRNFTEWWEVNSLIVLPMLEQRVTNAGFNFRYGGTYLTPSKLTACRYATSNRLGSEFLNTIYEAYEALVSVNPTEVERIVPSNHRLLAAFQEKWKPVLITLKNVNAENLRTEHGEPIGNQLDLMISMRKSGAGLDTELIWQQLNFELVGSIQWALLDATILNE